MKPIAGLAVALSLTALVAGCSSSTTEPSSSSPSTTSKSATVTGDVTVFAAASLKTTFTELGARFQNEYPGTRITFNFAGSADLVAHSPRARRRRVRLADTGNMAKAIDAGVVTGSRWTSPTNTLTIVTPPETPKVSPLSPISPNPVRSGGVRHRRSHADRRPRRSKGSPGSSCHP
jgi:molybdate transport system substrate-binding protein